MSVPQLYESGRAETRGVAHAPNDDDDEDPLPQLMRTMAEAATPSLKTSMLNLLPLVMLNSKLGIG